MHITRLRIKCIFFMASLTLIYSRQISFDIENIKRILPKKESCEGICMTPGCVKTAASILSSLDESVDPCENFYQFACGGWLNNHAIPAGKDHFSLYDEVEDELQIKIKALMEKELDGTEPAFIKMLKDFYDSCMDLDAIDKLGSEPLKKDLAILGGWPVVEGSNWNESSFDWVDTLIAFRRLGYNFNMLIYLSVYKDEQNSTMHIIKLYEPYLDLNLDFLRGLNDSRTADHYKIGVKESELLGADVNTAEKELLEALQFEIELGKLVMPEEEEKDEKEEPTLGEYKHIIREKKRKRRDVRPDVTELDSRYTVAELQNMIPEIPWLRFFNGLLNDEIEENEIVLVSNPVMLKNVANLLEKTEKRVVANYMFWRMVNFVKSDLSKEWREMDTNHKGQEKRRVDTCIDKVSEYLSIALSSYYIRHYFKEESKERVMELIKYIHRELLRIIEDSDWMDDVTKKQAIEKANGIKMYIGYPNELLNDSAIMDVYEKLTISNSSYYESVLKIQKWGYDKGLSSLRKPRIKSKWTYHAYTTYANAQYFPQINTIEIPAGILQNFFFDKDRPHYVNFAAIGNVIGHEITHGFDTKGKKYDKDGNEVNWWDKTTDELYHKRVQCMIEQYSNYTLESGIKVNGELTRGENIADNGAVKESYRAYQTWVKNHGQEPLLPGLKYTQNQLFWISAAKVWCSKTKPEKIEHWIRYHVHSPDEFRVIGPMSNLPEFSKDFNCPSDSPMNRKNKCHVW